jgi:hypothetical protein
MLFFESASIIVKILKKWCDWEMAARREKYRRIWAEGCTVAK